MDEERLAKILQFQYRQMIDFIHEVRAAGGIDETLIYPQATHDSWVLQFTFFNGGSASWIVSSRQRAHQLRDQVEELLLDADEMWGPTDMPASA